MDQLHPLTRQIKNLIVENSFWYQEFVHEPVRTSEQAAKIRTGYTLSQGAKALIVRAKVNGENKFIMLVIPGDQRFDKKKAQSAVSSKDIRFATEEEVAEITGGVQVGGVPPFGNLFGLEVIADPRLLANEKIIFNAGDRSYSIAMQTGDYRKIVNPRVAEII